MNIWWSGHHGKDGKIGDHGAPSMFNDYSHDQKCKTLKQIRFEYEKTRNPGSIMWTESLHYQGWEFKNKEQE